jgi:hypothetical protein
LKTCSECRRQLPLTAFGRFARAKDGLRYQCLECNRVRARKAYTFAGPPRVIVCGWCGNQHEARNPRTKWCSGLCKTQAAEARRTAKAGERPSRRCSRCGVEVETRVGTPVCPDCRVDRRDTGPQRDRARTLRKYGLTEAEWDAILAAQGGLCAICNTDTPGGRGERWHIDHDHATNRGVRGLLCHNCNVGIGNFHDSPELLEQAARYLREATRRPLTTATLSSSSTP